MIITIIVTISPIIPLEYLNALIHSLNLQTLKSFDVIFYNQTKFENNNIIGSLRTKPNFNYKIYKNSKDKYLGNYPLWDLYGFINSLLENDLIGDYLFPIHMEEFFETEYIEAILKVLEKKPFDIIFGNLYRTPYFYSDVKEIIKLNKYKFDKFIEENISPKSQKWGLPPNIFKPKKNILKNFQIYRELGFSRQLTSTNNGYKIFKKYLLEDVFIMSKKFAVKYKWFEFKSPVYFEDVHINFVLENLLKDITIFPIYFNKAKLYHLLHPKYYYQIEDENFRKYLFKLNTNDPILNSLKDAINFYLSGKLSLEQAIRYSRKNDKVTGCTNIVIEKYKRTFTESK